MTGQVDRSTFLFRDDYVPDTSTERQKGEAIMARRKGNPRYRKVTKRVARGRGHKGYTRTVYRLKKGAKRK